MYEKINVWRLFVNGYVGLLIVYLTWLSSYLASLFTNAMLLLWFIYETSSTSTVAYLLTKILILNGCFVF